MKEDTKKLLFSLAELSKQSVILLFKMVELILVICGFCTMMKYLFK